MRTYENIQKIETGQGDDATTGFLVHFPYFKKYCKIIVKDLSKQQSPDVFAKPIKQIGFIENLGHGRNASCKTA